MFPRNVLRLGVTALTIAALALLQLPPAQADRVRPELFGMDWMALSEPPPFVSAPTTRILLRWAQVEKEPGLFDWSRIDGLVAKAEASGAEPLVTAIMTPKFYAVGDPGFPTTVRPPKLSAYRTFIRVLAQRYGTRIDYQLWAEMNVPGNFLGTPRRMAKMARIASQEVRAHAAGALVVAPHGPIRYRTNRQWFRAFWGEQVGGKPVAEWVDVASLSGYPRSELGPEEGIKLVKWLRWMTAEQGFSGPIWIVEINYDVNGEIPTVPISVERQIANVVKTYVLNASIGTERVYWYYLAGPQTNANTAVLTADNQVAPPGNAFVAIQPWLIGTQAAGCTVAKSDIYTCVFTTKRFERHVIWTRSGRDRSTATPLDARRVYTVDGTVRRVRTEDRVRVGLIPVMIESRRIKENSKG